ncbi:MAG: insulinase family protein [Lachnospiraceae bacterium]|nr:insulinase family protein [Lachnospiraceae bacterium]
MTQTVNVEWIFPTGAAADPLPKMGLTHFAEHCLLKARFGEERLIDVSRRFGANINAKTGDAAVTVSIDIADTHLEQFLEFLGSWRSRFAEGALLDEAYLESERRCILQEMESKAPNHSNHILGSKDSLMAINEGDLRQRLGELLQGDMHMEFHSPMGPRGYLGSSQETSRCKTIRVLGEGKEDILLLSLRLPGGLGEHLREIGWFLEQYLNRNTSIARIYLELGCLSIFFHGSMAQIYQGLQAFYQLPTQDLSEHVPMPKATFSHTLEDIQCQMLQGGGQASRLRGNQWQQLFLTLLYDNAKPSVVSTIELNEQWLSLFPMPRVLPLPAEPFIKPKGRFQADELVQIWKAPNYFSGEKYCSHIVWRLLSGTTGALYQQWVLANNWCYSFNFYPRELACRGYMVLYVKINSAASREMYQNSFRQVVEDVSSNLTNSQLAWAKEEVLREKGDAKNRLAEWIGIGTRLLYDEAPNEDYAEAIGAITRADIQRFLRDYLLVDPAYVF